MIILRKDVLKRKTEMEKIWDYWKNNLQGKGCPPPSPYIMDWDSISFKEDIYESETRSMKIIMICSIILVPLLFCLLLI